MRGSPSQYPRGTISLVPTHPQLPKAQYHCKYSTGQLLFEKPIQKPNLDLIKDELTKKKITN